eukprot:2454701-Rhodomonas_salina.3
MLGSLRVLSCCPSGITLLYPATRTLSCYAYHSNLSCYAYHSTLSCHALRYPATRITLLYPSTLFGPALGVSAGDCRVNGGVLGARHYDQVCKRGANGPIRGIRRAGSRVEAGWVGTRGSAGGAPAEYGGGAPVYCYTVGLRCGYGATRPRARVPAGGGGRGREQVAPGRGATGSGEREGGARDQSQRVSRDMMLVTRVRPPSAVPAAHRSVAWQGRCRQVPCKLNPKP